MNVSSYLEGEYGLNDLYIGTPTVINGNGADRVIELKLEEDELTRFKQSSHIYFRASTTLMLSLNQF